MAENTEGHGKFISKEGHVDDPDTAFPVVDGVSYISANPEDFYRPVVHWCPECPASFTARIRGESRQVGVVLF
jgi:hypothetical protein